MEVGNNIAILRQDKAGAGGGALSVVVVVNLNVNGYYAADILVINLRGAHCFSGSQGTGNYRTGGGAVPVLEVLKLLLKLLNLQVQLIHGLGVFGIPVAVHGKGGNTAAARNQGDGQHSSQEPAPEAGLLFGRFGALLRRIGEAFFLPGHPDIGGVFIGRGPPGRQLRRRLRGGLGLHGSFLPHRNLRDFLPGRLGNKIRLGSLRGGGTDGNFFLPGLNGGSSVAGGQRRKGLNFLRVQRRLVKGIHGCLLLYI